MEKLVGMTEVETRERLGPPSFEEEAAPAKIWLYSADSCIFKVYFFPEVNSLVYRVLRYETLGTVSNDECLAEIRQVGGSGSDGEATSRGTS